MNRKSRLQSFALAAALGLASGASAPAHADDTEIYFSAAANRGFNTENLPNVLVILDTSQSMSDNRIDPENDASITRLEALKNAMKLIIGRANNVRFGLMRFSGEGQGGPVLYPVARIEEDAAVVEGDADLPEVVVAIADGDDDAEQAADGTMFVSNDRLGIPLRGAQRSFDIRVGQRSDDAAESLITNQVTNSEILPFFTPNRRNAFRFENVPIPANATVLSANLEVTQAATFDGSAQLAVRGERARSAATFRESDRRNISQRPLTTANVAWDVPFTRLANAQLRSPDISSVLQEIVGPAGGTTNPLDWAANNAMAFMVDHTGGTTKFIFSRDFSAADSARLVGVYEQAPGAAQQQRVGLRFQRVEIPQGARIKSAHIEFEATVDSDATDASVVIAGHDVVDSPPFSSTPNDISDRLSAAAATSAKVPWSIPQFEAGGRFQSADVSAIVQEIVNQAGPDGWCGGNAMTFLIQAQGPAVTGLRFANAFESSGGGAPVLRVDYDQLADLAPNTNGCTTKTVQVQVAASQNDATEASDGDVTLGSSTYDLADPGGRTVGLRFTNVPVPRNADVTDARLVFTASQQNEDPVNVGIAVQQSTSPAEFDGDRRADITDRPFARLASPWAAPTWLGPGQTNESVNLASIVRPIVGGTWTPGNAMVFALRKEGFGTGRRPVRAYEGGPTQAPVLRISYRTNFQPRSDLQLITVRDRLENVVNELQAFGLTPLVEAMTEGARYFRGDDVVYGLKRGNQGPSTERTRVSHLASYVHPPGPGLESQKIGNCTNENLGHPDCRTEEIPINAVYNSPITGDAPCEANYLIILSDGEPEATTNVAEIQALTGKTCEEKTRGQCGAELAEFLATVDQRPDVPGTQHVFTYTISFGSQEGTEFLNELATKGKPEGAQPSFFTAKNAGELVDVFDNIIAKVIGRPSSFAAPALSVNAFNKLFHLNEVYFSLFAPTRNTRWDGNVKKFALCEEATVTSPPCTPGEVLDVNLRPAVFGEDDSVPEADRGRIKDSSLSVWTDLITDDPDGAVVTEGGAAIALRQSAYVSRNLYTYTGSADALTTSVGPAVGLDLAETPANHVTTTDPDAALLQDNPALTAAMLNVPDAATRQDVILWMRGKDVLSLNPPTDISRTRFAFGDPLHSSPVAVTYGKDGNDNPITKIFVGTNDGAVRMLNGATGREEWAFVPREMLAAQRELMQNNETRARTYGVDGTPTLWVNDVNDDGIIDPDAGDFVHLFIGMRRGGRNYYAINVTPAQTLTSSAWTPGTPPTVKPRLMWRILGGTGEFTRLGQSWSRPLLTSILSRDPADPDTTVSKPVLIFGGGYDPSLDSTFATSPEQGNAIFIVDPADGSRIWWASNDIPITLPDGTEETADLVLAGQQSIGTGPETREIRMDYPIPSDLALLDTTGDGNTDRVYVGDVGANVWRIDLDVLDASDDGDTSGAALAVLSEDLPGSATPNPANNRSFFHAPDVVQVRDPKVTSGDPRHDIVGIVTGRRPNPLSTVVHDRIYALRDFNTEGRIEADFVPIQNTTGSGGDLYDATDDLIIADSSDADNLTRADQLARAKGWFLDLREPTGEFIGEKGLSRPVILAGTMFVTTFVPVVDPDDLCAAAEGLGRLYGLNVLNGNAVYNWDNPGSAGPLTRADRIFKLGSGIPSDAVPIFQKEGIQLLVGTSGGAQTVDPNIALPRERTYWFQQ